jgi:hypothetical protein
MIFVILKIAKNAQKHILQSCDQLFKQRQNVFKYGGSGDFETGYFAPDLVKLKYNDRPMGNVDSRWIEDGDHFDHHNVIAQITNDDRSIEEIGERWIEDGDHFDHTRLIAQITNNSTIGANILIEVY